MLSAALKISQLPSSSNAACGYESPRQVSASWRWSPAPSRALRSHVAPSPLAEPFSPTVHAHRHRTPDLYFSPSNPFCRRRLFPSTTSPARRLDYSSRPHYTLATEIRPLIDGVVWLIEATVSRCEHDALVRVFFWAALVVFLSSICGLGQTPRTASDFAFGHARLQHNLSSSHSWRAGEYHDYLEGIWETDRRFI